VCIIPDGILLELYCLKTCHTGNKPFTMLVNFMKTALRFLKRNVAFTIINVIGLSAGIAAFILIVLYIQNELSYDRNQPDGVEVYRMIGIQEPPGIDVQHVAITSGGWAPFIKENIPSAVEAVRLMHSTYSVDVDGESHRAVTLYSEGRAACFFGFPIIRGGNEADLLISPHTAIISKEMAVRLFGSVDVLGKTFRNNDNLYAITGVFDREGYKSHMEFDVLLSISTIENDSPWLLLLGNNSVITYVALTPDADVALVESMINDHFESQRLESPGLMKNTFYLQPVSDIYLRSQHVDIQSVSNVGNISSVYVFSLVALMVLAIACFNFINLSTANASNRAREVGMRKVLGAGRRQLALQFIGESLILTLFSLLIALLILEFVVPEFNTLLGMELTIDFISNPLFNVGLIFILAFVGLLAGFYPGLVMAKFQPVEVLKSQTQSGKPQSVWLRKILVILQFAISTGLILATIVVLHQVRHMQNKDRGYNPENVMYLRFDEGIGYEYLNNFREHLRTFPGLTGIGLASNYNGVAGKQSYVTVLDSVQTNLMCRYGYVDPDFFPVMGIEVIEGRNFSYENATDPYQAAIINEAAQRAFGWDNPVGKRVHNSYHDDYESFTIIGVVNDYNYHPVRLPIQPAIYLYQKDRLTTMNIRYDGGLGQDTHDLLEMEHAAFFPSQVFRSFFLEEILARQTRNEENTMKLFLWSSILCILISCLGLFGLTSYTMNRRRKEISVRRVLGASVLRVNILLVGSFMKTVLIAVGIALPVVFFIMNDWLSQYPYRIGIGVIHMAGSVILIGTIAMATVLFYSTKAARSNPVENLKHE